MGDLVLKPLDRSELELEWQAAVLGSIAVNGFRTSQPRRAGNGALAFERWCAWEWMAGSHEKRRWPEIIAVGERFHAAVKGVPQPAFLTNRSDPWAMGDRVAWGQLPPDELAETSTLARLLAALVPIKAPSQLIHGDLSGNVLFDAELAPAIIDLSPYWRPIGFASAIVVADALVWEGAEADILGVAGHIEDFDQFLLRALIYRLVTDEIFHQKEPGVSNGADPYSAAVDLACQLARSSR